MLRDDREKEAQTPTPPPVSTKKGPTSRRPPPSRPGRLK